MSFYAYVLRRLLDEGKITTSSRTLAVCAGPVDADALHEAGFTDVALFYAAFAWRGWVAHA